MPEGSLKKLGVESNAISGTVDWEYAADEMPIAKHAQHHAAFIFIPSILAYNEKNACRDAAEQFYR
jgi:hypothetical protein